MGAYTEKKIYDISTNFRRDELESVLKGAEEDLAKLPEFIELVKKQIEEVSKEEFAPALLMVKGSYEDGYKISLVKAPKDIDTCEGKHSIKGNFPILKGFKYREKEKDTAISCCEELISKYSIPRQRIFTSGFNEERLNEWINSIFDEICSGKSYKEKLRQTGDKKLNYRDLCHEEEINGKSDFTDRKIGSRTGILSDGRHYRAECWSEDEYTFVTFFFSTEDIESLEKCELTELLKPQLDYSKIPEKNRNPGAKIIRDKSGNRMWSVTYLLFEGTAPGAISERPRDLRECSSGY